ncbi:protein KTI12 [Metschnikowia aff. pulcherrima]|uniref:Protein KTI12 n=1 Tax=Metschnikowia aff. pulcherrima TaxID=2163413 RepID=A0A4P6XMI3_9ASCO|nr:protein KTI12 [Metschnikowia aff. pulcherrima]
MAPNRSQIRSKLQPHLDHIHVKLNKRVHTKYPKMPLITFTGLPCSGKTRWAEQLIEQLEHKIAAAQESSAPGHNYKIVYHSDETLGISPMAYKESATEKHARGTQLLAVKRDLSRSTFVILDSLSYIKGFRYQLFCEAKGVVTPHCVIQVMNSVDTCVAWNDASSPKKWDSDVIHQLSMRYEEPNADSRWDSPLFTVVSDYAGETLPVDQIWEALVLKRPPPPNAATLVKPTTGNDYMQDLERLTLEVVTKVVQHQQLTSAGGNVVVDALQNICVEIPTEAVSIAQLQRIRRTFVGLNRMRSIDVHRIQSVFVDYLNKSLNE